MKGFGIALSTLGVVGLSVVLNLDPGVDGPYGRVINLHKASERQNYIIISSIVFLGGLVLVGCGAVAGGNKRGDKRAQARQGPDNETPENISSLKAMRDAAVNGDTCAAAKLLDEGLDVNDHYKGIPWLHMACLNGHTAIVELLIQRGADPALADQYGSYPLEHAQSGGHTPVVALLKKHGA
jgi:ankyrin repeat protein